MSDSSTIRLLVVDDHPLFLEGIATVIAHQPDIELVGRAATARQAVEEFRRALPDVTLMDLRLPDMSGISAVTAIRAEFSEAKVIVLTTFEGDVEIQRALAAGVRAYLLKTAPFEDLVEAIRKVHAGRKHLSTQVAETLAEHFNGDALSEREIEVLERMAEGDRNRDIGERLSISKETVKVHIRHIMDKLGAKGRTQAVWIGLRRGVIHLWA
jgi:DNA-binding NarL/FixJ family response regulator